MWRMTADLPSIAILGAGSMGGAILAGLLRTGAHLTQGIRVTTRRADAAARLHHEGVVSLALETDENANRAAVLGARLVILGVKPAMIPDLLDEIAPAITSESVIVSVAAGVTIESMQARVDAPVMRAMPNTPSAIGHGVTALAAGPRVSADDLAAARRVFGAIGTVLEVDEAGLDAVTAISGSGPAYVYYLIEQLMNAAVSLGFSLEESSKLALGTFTGSVLLLQQSGEDPAELRRRVTSPNGTTERAIAAFDEGGMPELFERAVNAARQRAREIAAGG